MGACTPILKIKAMNKEQIKQLVRCYSVDVKMAISNKELFTDDDIAFLTSSQYIDHFVETYIKTNGKQRK